MTRMQSNNSPTPTTPFVSRLFSDQGMTVNLQTQQVGQGEWLLRIYGSHGQVSEWIQCFDSPIEAMIAGLSAIQIEGIERFYDDPNLTHPQGQTNSQY